jgi:hypothetical protein
MTTELPSALIVVNERNAHRRITDLLRRRGHTIEDQPNGDRAVDTYVKMRRESPTVVFLSLDVAGPLNGHLVGLEIRESDPNARLVYICSRIRRSMAEDVAYSAGAVAILQVPFTMSDIEDSWDQIMGPVPEAPGLLDLDALYPDLRSIDGDEVVPVDELAPLPIPTNLPPPPEPLMPINPVQEKKKKRRGTRRIISALFWFGLGAGIAAGIAIIEGTVLEYLP